jgi:hypothetical protein
LTASVLLCTCLLMSCTSGGGDDDGDNGNNNDDGNTIEGSYRTDCGVVQNAALKNPVNADDGIVVTIDQIVSEHVLIASPSTGGKILVKLQGLASESSLFESVTAKNTLQRAAKSAVVFPAADGCSTVVEGGGNAMVASVIEASSGKSLAEKVLLAGGGDVASADTCGGGLLTSCFQALEEDGEASNPPVGATVTNFLWKPVSESTGTVAVLLSPKATVVVNGETFRDTGSSNGRATTARGSKPGCAYGSPSIQAFDTLGRSLVFPGGVTTYVISNGCDRIEFQ